MTRCLSYTTVGDKDERRDEIASGSPLEISGSLLRLLLGVLGCDGLSWSFWISGTEVTE